MKFDKLTLTLTLTFILKGSYVLNKINDQCEPYLYNIRLNQSFSVGEGSRE